MQENAQTTVAMQYKHLPVVDFFRKVDDDIALGRWTMRGKFIMYFVLVREGKAC